MRPKRRVLARRQTWERLSTVCLDLCHSLQHEERLCLKDAQHFLPCLCDGDLTSGTVNLWSESHSLVCCLTRGGSLCAPIDSHQQPVLRAEQPRLQAAAAPAACPALPG